MQCTESLQRFASTQTADTTVKASTLTTQRHLLSSCPLWQAKPQTARFNSCTSQAHNSVDLLTCMSSVLKVGWYGVSALLWLARNPTATLFWRLLYTETVLLPPNTFSRLKVSCVYGWHSDPDPAGGGSLQHSPGCLACWGSGRGRERMEREGNRSIPVFFLHFQPCMSYRQWQQTVHKHEQNDITNSSHSFTDCLFQFQRHSSQARSLS